MGQQCSTYTNCCAGQEQQFLCAGSFLTPATVSQEQTLEHEVYNKYLSGMKPGYAQGFSKSTAASSFTPSGSSFNIMTTFPISESQRDKVKLRAVIKIQSLARAVKVKRAAQALLMFRLAGIKELSLQDVALITESPCLTVQKIEKRIGQSSLVRELRDFYKNSKTSSRIVFKKEVKMNNGTIYTGQVDSKTQLREGFGVQIWPDGSKYTGQWRLGKANGYGRFILADGDCYEGDWKEDKAHGQGTYLYSDGARFIGEWVNDKQEGEGQESWPDGSHYFGKYRDGKKNGEGCFTWVDGATYQGQWSQNKMHGIGLFKWPDGRAFKGEYQNDKKHGSGVYTSRDGRQREGLWMNGKQIKASPIAKSRMNEDNYGDSSKQKGRVSFLSNHGTDSCLSDSSRYVPN